ncbi:MAG: succinylglutamate desuccinylase/aspartoacylase family protein [Gammaproteobacteria bacterium]|nr:succinylglutamate desuccinylase/aspartoacylase family protein [Gammaproteobacteria bacterium]
MPDITSIQLPQMSPGSRRTLKVMRFGSPGARPKAYLQAGVHADEIPGLLVLHHLIQRLNACLLDRADL